MTYVIAFPCVDVKDKSCIEECPVDCIYEGDRMLYIQPDECVDCGACEPVCPVEAIFYVDCQPGDVNSQYSGADGHGPAVSCEEAQRRATAVHRKYLQVYGLDSTTFPMLKLKPDDWKSPFVAMPWVNEDVTRRAGR